MERRGDRDMSKHMRKASSKSTRQVARTGGHLLIPGVFGLAILVGAATWYLLPQRNLLSDAAQSPGGPRLVVDKELVDFGTVRFNKMVNARFLLRNVGDQPLKLAVDQRVEAIEGC
jgi:hypothetical protein